MEREDIKTPLIENISQEVGDGGGVFEEVKKQVWLAGPLVCVSLLQYSLQLISIMFVGHLGELSLSGASMATSFASVTGFSLFMGMASALDTLCGQSYGAKQYHMLGIYMQRAMFILMLVSIPLAFIWFNTGSILKLVGQDHDIAEEAGLYAQFMLPSLFAYGLLQCLVRFLQTQNIVFPMMVSSGIATLLHVLICWILVFKSGLGSKGAALANAISYWNNVILLALYVKFSSSCAKTWTGFSVEALHGILAFIKLAIPSAVMVCLEMWSFEMIVLLSGLLPQPKLETSVLSICLNTAAVMWMIPFGLSGAVSTRVSNELGAGHPRTARMAVIVVLVVAVVVGILIGSVLILIRNFWGYAYSNEIEVVQYVATMLPILATSNFLDGLQCVLSVKENEPSMMGMASALDTLCGQSYGAKQYHMLGIYMQRAMFILMLVSIPLAFIWFNTGSILKLVGQDHDIAEEAGLYAQFMLPSLFAYGLLQCLVRFLQTQNIVFPMMVSSGIATLLHVLICWILVFKSGLGSKGAALANAISYWNNVILLALYVKFSSSCAKTWTGFSVEALHGILAFIKLAIPSAVMVCLEMWSFEMIVLLSGLLPQPKLETSVLSICLNTAAVMWMIPFGLSGAVSTRVSNELGAGHPRTARMAVIVVLVVAVVVGILIGSVLILIRNFWGYAYSNEIEVVQYVATMLPILATSNFLDGLQCVLSGSVRGCGWQKIGAYINLGAYYLVGIPLAVLLAFVFHVGGKGLWFGIIGALLVQVALLLTITIRTNWDAEAKNAQERVYESALPVNIVS